MNGQGHWLRRHQIDSPVRARLVCFPHAGGTAGSFSGWADRLPLGTELIAVQYPGRQDRIAEPPVADMAQMAKCVADALLPMLDRPMILFGHSMGTGLSYEVAWSLENSVDFVMDHVFVSARPPPHRINGEHRHRLPEKELISEMRELGGADAEAYDYPNLLPLIIPPLRSDLALLDQYRPQRLDPLRAPLTVFGGKADDTCSSEKLAAWADATTAGTRVQLFPGGHHYLRESETDVVRAVSGVVAQTRPH